MWNLKFRDILPSNVVDELDAFSAQLRAWATREHDGDGKHTDITAESISSENEQLEVNKGLRFNAGPWYFDPVDPGSPGVYGVPVNSDGSVIRPPAIAANQNDYNPVGLNTAVIVELSSDAERTITGFVKSERSARFLYLYNAGLNTINLAHLSSSSTAGNRMFVQSTGENYPLRTRCGATLYYDTTNEHWVIVAASRAQTPIDFGPPLSTGGSASTMENYYESTWTPEISFVTPGDLAVGYTTQVGFYTLIGDTVHASFVIVTSSFTHATASGNAIIKNLPYTSISTSNYFAMGPLQWGIFTPAAGTTDVNLRLPANTTSANLVSSGAGVSSAFVTTAHLTSGSTIVLVGSITYKVG